MGVTAIGAWVALGLLSVSSSLQYIDLGPAWSIETKGPWVTRVDHRGLLAMRHPWTPSEEGNFAMARREVELPADWQGPVRLAFYVSDDYHTGPNASGTDALAAEGFVGHRRKQILVNDVLVWSQDVSDPVLPGQSPYVSVPLELDPAVRTFRIALLAYDTVASSKLTKEDYYRPPKPGLTRETDPDAARFRTTVYWGDLALVSEDAALAARPRPSERMALERHNRTWPPEPDEKPWQNKLVELAVSAPAGLPAGGFPLEMGLPLPAGVVEEVSGFRLRHGRTGRYAQKSASATWPDGSLRWVQLYFPVTSATNTVSLGFDKDAAQDPAAIKVQDDEGTRMRLESDTLSLEMAPGDPLGAIALKGKVMVNAVRLNLEVAGDTAPGTSDSWRVVEEGPAFVCTALEGRFEGLAESYGSFTLYVSVYQGLPHMKLWLRIFNDTARNLAVSHLRVVFALPEAPGTVTVPHGKLDGDFALTQTEAGFYQIGGEQFPAESPFFLQWDRGALAVKRFRERYPKGAERAGNTLSLDLIAGGNTPMTLTPGEAQSHEIWLALGKADGAQLAATVEQPPVLQNTAYWCATGVLGPAAPFPAESPVTMHLKETAGGKSWADLGQSLGLRHFPDSPYLGRKGEWSNDYNGRMMSLWSLWLATGDRAWFDRASDVCAHLMDVAIVHTEVPGRSWLGSMHGPGANHVAGPWNPTLGAEGLSLFGHLTGNPDAQTDFLSVADYCVRTGAGIRGGNARQVAGPFSTVCAAYRETGELAFLEAGAARLAAMLERVDRRRGVWYDWHGSEVYPGTVPWMAAQLAGPLYAWYQLTGDVEAAQLLVGLADSLICENTLWDTPGAMRDYSPNPRYPDTTAYDPFIVPLLFAAFELTEDTFFRDAARAQWARWRASPAYLSAFDLGWHWPWLNGYLAGLDSQAE